MDNLVTLSRFVRRLKQQRQRANKLLTAYRKGAEKNFRTYMQDYLWMDARKRILEEVLQATDSKTATVESIRAFALRRVLTMADNRNSNPEEMGAWAFIVDLTEVGSLHT